MTSHDRDKPGETGAAESAREEIALTRHALTKDEIKNFITSSSDILVTQPNNDNVHIYTDLHRIRNFQVGDKLYNLSNIKIPDDSPASEDESFRNTCHQTFTKNGFTAADFNTIRMSYNQSHLTMLTSLIRSFPNDSLSISTTYSKQNITLCFLKDEATNQISIRVILKDTVVTFIEQDDFGSLIPHDKTIHGTISVTYKLTDQDFQIDQIWTSNSKLKELFTRTRDNITLDDDFIDEINMAEEKEEEEEYRSSTDPEGKKRALKRIAKICFPGVPEATRNQRCEHFVNIVTTLNLLPQLKEFLEAHKDRIIAEGFSSPQNISFHGVTARYRNINQLQNLQSADDPNFNEIKTLVNNYKIDILLKGVLDLSEFNKQKSSFWTNVSTAIKQNDTRYVENNDLYFVYQQISTLERIKIDAKNKLDQLQNNISTLPPNSTTKPNELERLNAIKIFLDNASALPESIQLILCDKYIEYLNATDEAQQNKKWDELVKFAAKLPLPKKTPNRAIMAVASPFLSTGAMAGVGAAAEVAAHAFIGKFIGVQFLQWASMILFHKTLSTILLASAGLGTVGLVVGLIVLMSLAIGKSQATKRAEIQRSFTSIEQQQPANKPRPPPSLVVTT